MRMFPQKKGQQQLTKLVENLIQYKVICICEVKHFVKFAEEVS